MILRLMKPIVLSCSKCLLYFLVVLFLCNQSINAQNATTDPSEVRALSSIFQQWQIQAGDAWNISGEPCSGVALSQSDSVFEDTTNNPGIRCDCSFNNATVCHITRLKVYALNSRGEIPKELSDLPFLTFLKIDQNFFSGHLPAFIGNMSRLESLTISINDFSGPIPEELGNLKQLRILSFGANHFYGTLPPQLGDLVNLELLYIDSCGLGGEIPSTFSKLENLREVWASDNAFTGKIPDFVGNNWTKLTSLRFQGNSFDGPIPSSLANLISLISLRIGDINNGSSSLGFVINLTNLVDLVLRNVLLTGSLPSYITGLNSLEKLDLSFNNLTGPIPSDMFAMDSLKHLFLGNNSLTDGIPDIPYETHLQTIDLSYNLLSGDLPSWVDAVPRLNLVGNYFTLNSSNITRLPGLQCLQRSFPCFRNAPQYAKLAINCGGPQVISDGIVFNADNRSLGPATYVVYNTQKWAVSNVGLFADRMNPMYVENSLSPFRSTNTTELYRTSRLSPGSLRYHGLGLENGPYNVTLFFAETGFVDRYSHSWKSRARRVFDVYIQVFCWFSGYVKRYSFVEVQPVDSGGALRDYSVAFLEFSLGTLEMKDLEQVELGTRQLRDFDIWKEAGGVERGIVRSFTADVTTNYLEIHLFWAGKGTCCVPEQGYYGPSISAISVVPNFRLKEKNWTALIAGVTVPVVGLALILIFVIFYIKRQGEDEEEEVLLGISNRPNTFSYSELKAATEDFSPSNKLGEGGFGAVYKGTFSDGRVVAVKQLTIASHHGKSQFIAEVTTISAVQHRNLVKLHGYCIKGKSHLLVYEYLENKSLDKALFGHGDLHLDWPTRFNICLETARGLAYLHEESRPRIVHRDIKASNILLDEELCPKISDFGLAKLYDDKKTHISTKVAGTMGYLAPEYAMYGHLTEKADVFGFGIVALEILSGRPNFDNSLEDDKIYLLAWAWALHENNQYLDLVDPNLVEFDENKALRMARVALLCTQGSPSMRPPMSRVVAMLAGDIEVSNAITRPSYLTDWNFRDSAGRVVTGDTHGSGAAPILSSVNVSEFSVMTEGSQCINGQNATTVPSEVRALNSIIQRWEIQVGDSWNSSGEPCSEVGFSQNYTGLEYFSNITGFGFGCDCSFNHGTVCHITHLMAINLDLQGTIPEELLDLPFLTTLSIPGNNFSGHLPKELGNLKELHTLLIDYNDFSGSIPKEIGNLKKLRTLSFAVNNFSGTLPPQLGNLVNLERLYIDGCGLGGEIPSTFANLENLQVVWASDNAFTGKIPDFIGNNWTKLTSLRFQGNSFEGPIPSSFAKLTSLIYLQIGDIYNGSSSLDFVENLTNLTDLSLRNVLLTGSLQSYITGLYNLEKLDLSFNNLTGTIPSDMFTMTSLKHLFLGNNSLTGAIPNIQTTILQTIDLSYNLLSGDLPSWVDTIRQLNLVGNNFTPNSSNIGILPGLECLQRSFPCNRDAPLYAKFSIKCGGQQIISNGTVFEGDYRPLGTATYAVTDAKNWAVSNVGLFEYTENQHYLQSTSAQVGGTDTPELYKSSRISPGSLRYYGLGLENGPYTVNLFFAEIGFPGRTSKSWRSLTRRVFDVYIQGTRELRDFDISKEAGDAETAIIKNFTANVTANHLEIHLFWAGKGTSWTQDQSYYGPSISAISVTPNFIPTVGIPKEKNQTALTVGITVSVVLLSLILIFAIIYVKRKRDDEEEEVLLGISNRPNTFSYSELKEATEDFSPSNKLGEGGFGAVYKGTFSDGRVAAVKQLTIASHHGKSQFIAEVTTISAVQHRNLVKLHGYCIKGKSHLLVYEYLENKSLDKALFGRSGLHLDWPTRFNICLETARGLAYLHDESRPRIVHRDIKASNILLDAELCPKISDFGLAKLYDDKKTHISTKVAGTMGYLAPEYAMYGHLTEKADVFGFGIVALEILSGRPNFDNSLEDDKIYLLAWAWTLHENGQYLDLVDPNLVEFDENEALRVARVALLCTQGSPSIRPPMSRVVAMLAGDIEVSNAITRPSYLTDWNFRDSTGRVVTGDTHGSGAAPNLSSVNVSEFSDITEGR
ncbi:hypothetical protein GQ457_09G004560 [Hibiscus cannabinus]